MKIATIVGARPQFIKASAVSAIIRATSSLEEVLIHTGQHFDKEMSDIFFEELELQTPDYNLGVQSGSHGTQTGKMLDLIEQVLMKERPDSVLVYGDTNSTLAGALASAKLHIPVIHVEAGLRSFNRKMPEEINRILTDHCSDLLFAPTDTAVNNLRKEGVSESAIHNVGDVMYDVARYYGKKAEKQSDILRKVGIEPGQYFLATVHRAENTDNYGYLAAIFEGLCRAAKDTPVVIPLHPRTRQALTKANMIQRIEKNLKIIEPVGYLDMVMMAKKASLIATDSGGLQKEAFFHGIPCATLRTETEWGELVELGWNHLIKPSTSDHVYEGLMKAKGTVGKAAQPYGDGKAAKKITSQIIKTLS